MELDTNSKAAQLLNRFYMGSGFSAGPEFPGDTIRKSIAHLEKIGALTVKNGQFEVTESGKEYLFTNHLRIKS
jgi:hypothetical protein